MKVSVPPLDTFNLTVAMIHADIYVFFFFTMHLSEPKSSESILFISTIIKL